MFISVIIPTYNGQKFLEETIESVLAQTVREWELLIVDDGSTDTTRTVAQEYAVRDTRIRLITKDNEGVVSARNQGIAEACGEFVAMLDQDDLWEPDALETLRNTLILHPDAEAAHGLTREIDSEGHIIRNSAAEQWGQARRGVKDGKLILWPNTESTPFAVLAFWCCISTPGQVLVRRSALKAVGPLDSSCWPSDDWDLWLRLSQRHALAFVPQIIVNWRQHEGNVSKQRSKMRQAELNVRRKLLTTCAESLEHRRIARIGWRLGERMQLSLRLGWAKDHWKKREFVQFARQLRQAVICCVRSLTA